MCHVAHNDVLLNRRSLPLSAAEPFGCPHTEKSGYVARNLRAAMSTRSRFWGSLQGTMTKCWLTNTSLEVLVHTHNCSQFRKVNSTLIVPSWFTTCQLGQHKEQYLQLAVTQQPMQFHEKLPKSFKKRQITAPKQKPLDVSLKTATQQICKKSRINSSGNYFNNINRNKGNQLLVLQLPTHKSCCTHTNAHHTTITHSGNQVAIHSPPHEQLKRVRYKRSSIQSVYWLSLT